MNPGRMITQGGPKLVSTIGLLHTPDPPRNRSWKGGTRTNWRKTDVCPVPSVCLSMLAHLDILLTVGPQVKTKIELRQKRNICFQRPLWFSIKSSEQRTQIGGLSKVSGSLLGGGRFEELLVIEIITLPVGQNQRRTLVFDLMPL